MQKNGDKGFYPSVLLKKVNLKIWYFDNIKTKKNLGLVKLIEQLSVMGFRNYIMYIIQIGKIHKENVLNQVIKMVI